MGKALRTDSSKQKKGKTAKTADAKHRKPSTLEIPESFDVKSTSKIPSASKTSDAAEAPRIPRTSDAAEAPKVSDVSVELPNEELLYDLADLFRVFSDTMRIKILYALMENELCVADIAAAVGTTQSAVSHQMNILKQARLVRFSHNGKNIFYALSDHHIQSILEQGFNHLCE